MPFRGRHGSSAGNVSTIRKPGLWTSSLPLKPQLRTVPQQGWVHVGALEDQVQPLVTAAPGTPVDNHVNFFNAHILNIKRSL